MLDDEAIERYARQVVVPGIGASGQERLMATTVLVIGHPRGAAQAALYLQAAGARVRSEILGDSDLVIVAGAEFVDAALLASLASSGRPICWYVLDDDACTVGVHPHAPLPLLASTSGARAEWHDVCACDAASLACAIAIGLPHRREATRFAAGTAR
jgi:hypothetical protein